MSDGEDDVSDREEFEAEQKNGVYLLAVHSEYEGYTVRSATDRAFVENVTINGRYIGTSDYFETECDGFEIMEDGTLNLQYHDTSGEGVQRCSECGNPADLQVADDEFLCPDCYEGEKYAGGDVLSRKETAARSRNRLHGGDDGD